jgi:hypothetical protein
MQPIAAYLMSMLTLAATGLSIISAGVLLIGLYVGASLAWPREAHPNSH